MGKINFKIRLLARTKRLSMRFVGSQLLISGPLDTSDFEINGFIERSKGWILSRLKKIEQQDRLCGCDWVILWGNRVNVKLIKGRVTESYLDSFCGSTGDDIVDGNVIYLVSSKDVYISRLKRFLCSEFLKKAEELLIRHCDIMKISCYPKLRVKETRTRWGSFSNKNNINLNWRLVFAPVFILEYVIVHELCHYFEMNHSNRFWNLVNKYCPDYVVAEKYLKDNSLFLNQNFFEGC